MGWFIGMAFLPLLYKHSEYLSEHNWMPYVILSVFALAGGIIILCMQKVNFFLYSWKYFNPLTAVPVVTSLEERLFCFTLTSSPLTKIGITYTQICRRKKSFQ